MMPEELLEIKPVDVADNYEVVSMFMLHLHENEKRLHDKTAVWADIEQGYMRHIMAMQRDCEGSFLIAYVNGAPAGFIFGYLEDADDSRFEEDAGKELYVSEGMVLEAYRRRGIYGALNAELERIAIAQGAGRITRFTLVNNHEMQQFLEKENYKATRLLYEKWIAR